MVAQALGAFCRERLARYKVPSRFRFVAELPWLTSGKLDKVMLRAMIGRIDVS